MSKSLGNIIDPVKLIKTYGIDAIRFYFIQAGPQNHDINFEEKAITLVYFNHIPDKLSNLSRYNSQPYFPSLES
jgi:methionyl-tRNA synthetase